MRIPLFWKLFASHLGVVLLTALCVFLFASARTSDEAREQTIRWLHSKLAPLEALAVEALESGELGGPLQSTLEGLRGEDQTRYTVIAADGRVLADSDGRPADMENHGTRPEVLVARREGRGSSIRFSNTVRKELVYVAGRVETEVGLLGYVRVSVPVRELDRDRASLRRTIVFSVLVAVAIGFVLCLLLASRFARPLRDLTTAAEAIAAGDYDRRVPTRQGDEIGDLADAFGVMASNLRERIETISNERSELEAILSGMVEGVVAVDGKAELVLMNSAAGNILGVDPVEARGSSLWTAIPLRPVAEVVATCLDDREYHDAEVLVPGPPAERVLQLHAAPIGAASGGVVLVMHDLTEVRRLERIRRDFVANASHELKTPVTAIRGFVETILEDKEMDPETQHAFLGRVQRQTGRLTQIIEEMLALSRLEERVGRAPRREIDVRTAIEQAIDTVLPLAAERGVAIAPELPSEPVIVSASEEGLQRIIGNLLDNAVKFTAPGTQVEVELRRTDDGVLLSVLDRGPGIPVGDRERVFERFYRVDRGRTRDVGGTGLGLAIVKHLVQGLGGEIRVEAREGAGCAFRVQLPTA